MKTLTEVLRDADPAESETRSPEGRALTRMRVLSANTRPETPHPVSRRRVLALAAMGIAGIAAAVFVGRQASVDAIAAVRFEARLAEGRKTIVRNKDIARAEVVPGGNDSTFNISLTFTPDGARKMRQATERNIGKQLELLIDGRVVMSPVIRAAISGEAMITGTYTRAEADRIVSGIVGR